MFWIDGEKPEHPENLIHKENIQTPCGIKSRTFWPWGKSDAMLLYFRGPPQEIIMKKSVFIPVAYELILSVVDLDKLDLDWNLDTTFA